MSKIWIHAHNFDLIETQLNDKHFLYNMHLVTAYKNNVSKCRTYDIFIHISALRPNYDRACFSAKHFISTFKIID